MYVCFRVAPLGAPKIRAVKKERKLYLWDWSTVEDPGPRFENLVGAQLLKYCHFIEDTEGWPMELRYVRDSDRREMDFVVVRKRKPLFAVECKLSDRHVDSSLAYFAARTSIPRFFLVHLGKAHFERGKLTVLPFPTLCRELGLP
jgi:predicted AAA+ superfamily ATPase